MKRKRGNFRRDLEPPMTRDFGAGDVQKSVGNSCTPKLFTPLRKRPAWFFREHGGSVKFIPACSDFGCFGAFC